MFVVETYLEAFQTSLIKIFSENSQRVKVAQLYLQKSSILDVLQGLKQACAVLQ